MSTLTSDVEECYRRHSDNSELLEGCLISAVVNNYDGFSEAEIELAINDLTDAIKHLIINFDEETRRAIDEVVDGVAGDMVDIRDNITDDINSLTNDTSGFITNAYNRLLSDSELAINDVSSLTDSANLSILTQTATSISETNDLMTDIGGFVESTFMTVDNEVLNTFNEFDDALDLSLTKSFEKIQSNIDTTTESLGGEIDRLISEAAEDTAGFKSEADQTQSLISSLIDTVSSTIAGPIKPIIELVQLFIEKAQPGQLTKDLQQDNKEWSTLIVKLATAVNNPDEMAAIIEEHKGTLGWWGEMVLTLLYGMSGFAFFANMVGISNAARSEVMRQTVMSGQPVNIFSLSETVALLNRGFVSDEFAEEEALKSGYDFFHLRSAKLANETPLDPERLREALHRGFINESDYRSNLERSAYNETDISTLRSIADVRPSIQDLITMSVRDVYSRDIVERFQLFADLPTEFVKEAGKSGLSESWAEKYWGAHWRLPSANQGFEMFHRGVIDEDTLTLLLRALDVSPFWRDKLRDIAYNPITRIDIRRMFALGLIDEDEVKRRHLDLGYSPADAVSMTKFVTSLTVDSADDGDIDTLQISVTQIKKLYGMGTLSQEEAVLNLVASGYSREASELLVQSWDDAREIDQREDLLNRMIKRAIRESLTVDEVERLFSTITLTNDERERIFSIIEIEQRELNSIPSKSELKKMKESDVITLDEWESYMAQHGYNFIVVNQYKQLYGF